MADGEQHLKYFGLGEQPFAPTADPAYFYATRAHQECLYRLWNCIDARHGIAVVLGNYGTGKTTLLRKVVATMQAEPERYHVAVIGTPIPSWSSQALLEAIVAQFSIHPAEPGFAAALEALNQHLLEHREQVCTLVIDDAQNLNKRGQLELLRIVQNLETQQRKLLNLALFAQLEWTQVLDAAPNFAQRVDLTYMLEAVVREEIRDFVEYRLFQAGAKAGEGPVFSDAALAAIYAFTEGSPRLIITLCRNALLLAAQAKTRDIGHEIILNTIDTTTLPNPEKRKRVTAAVHEVLKQNEGPVVLDRESSERVARDKRSAELLLRGARSEQAEGDTR
jgi:type II secretory pathway predicted ATPase ExeA